MKTTKTDQYLFIYRDPLYCFYFTTDSEGNVCSRNSADTFNEFVESTPETTYYSPTAQVIARTQAKLLHTPSIVPLTQGELEQILKNTHKRLKAHPMSTPAKNA